VRILIIGSEGFVGSNCLKHFTELGFYVFGCDIIDKVEDNYKAIKSSENDFNELFENQKFDVCINAAGSANVSNSFLEPELDFSLNVTLIVYLLNAIKKHNSKCKFINLSSAAVYGNPSSLPISEDSILSPLSPYGYHKMLSEYVLLEYYKLFGINTCSLRVFSAYGPGLKKQLFWDLFLKLKSNNKVILNGTGLESRDFIFIDDLVNAIHIIIKSLNFNGQCINVSSGIETRIIDIVNVFRKYFNTDYIFEFDGNDRKGDPKNWLADLTKLKKLGFSHTIDIDSGIDKTIKWLNENYNL
jgi:UDP-glucose 4-epimerase